MDTRDLTSLRATEVFELSRANPEFIDRIIGTIPKDYETFEKILYVYFKMCAVLNYDSKFWASMQQGSITIPHLDYTRLEKYDETNNEIVCYEFTNLLKKSIRQNWRFFYDLCPWQLSWRPYKFNGQVSYKFVCWWNN